MSDQSNKKPDAPKQNLRPAPQPTRVLTHEELISEIKAAHRKTQEKARSLTNKIIYNDKGH